MRESRDAHDREHDWYAISGKREHRNPSSEDLSQPVRPKNIPIFCSDHTQLTLFGQGNLLLASYLIGQGRLIPPFW
jgi:hypothetical protein